MAENEDWVKGCGGDPRLDGKTAALAYSAAARNTDHWLWNLNTCESYDST
jgi:hypothetical protein